MTTRRIAGFVIAAAGIGFSVLAALLTAVRLGQPWFPEQPSLIDGAMSLAASASSMGIVALAASALLVLLFSRGVPRWWSLAYAAAALALLVAGIAWEGNAAAAFVARLQQDPDILRTGWTPAPTEYLVVVPRLILGVAASLAVGAPLIVPSPPARRPPDVPPRPLGL